MMVAARLDVLGDAGRPLVYGDRTRETIADSLSQSDGEAGCGGVTAVAERAMGGGNDGDPGGRPCLASNKAAKHQVDISGGVEVGGMVWGGDGQRGGEICGARQRAKEDGKSGRWARERDLRGPDAGAHVWRCGGRQALRHNTNVSHRDESKPDHKFRLAFCDAYCLSCSTMSSALVPATADVHDSKADAEAAWRSGLLMRLATSHTKAPSLRATATVWSASGRRAATLLAQLTATAARAPVQTPVRQASRAEG